jgi:hypothetical protein
MSPGAGEYAAIWYGRRSGCCQPIQLNDLMGRILCRKIHVKLLLTAGVARFV